MPLLAGAFIVSWRARIASVCAVTVAMLLLIGSISASLGGANKLRGAARVLVGGGAAMALTYGVGAAFSAIAGRTLAPA